MMKGMVPKPLSTPSTHTHTTPTPNPLDGGPAPLTVIVSFFGPSMPTPSCHLFCPPRPDAVSSFVRHPGARDRERSLPCTRPRTKKNEKENERDDRRESDPPPSRARDPTRVHRAITRDDPPPSNTTRNPPAFREPPKPACVQLPLRPLSGTSRSLSSVHARCPANLCPFGTIALNGLNRCLWNPRSRHTMRGASANNLSLSLPVLTRRSLLFCFGPSPPALSVD